MAHPEHITAFVHFAQKIESSLTHTEESKGVSDCANSEISNSA